jgi:hypothetical protein
MVKNKNSKYGWGVLAVVALAAGLAGYLYYKHHNSSNSSTVTVSDEKTFITDNNLVNNPGAGIPHSVKHQIATGIGVSWSQESAVDGNDTCFLFDETSHQIYAMQYRSSGDNATGTISTGETYYNNAKVSKNRAVKLLSESCYH